MRRDRTARHAHTPADAHAGALRAQRIWPRRSTAPIRQCEAPAEDAVEEEAGDGRAEAVRHFGALAMATDRRGWGGGALEAKRLLV